MIVLEKEKEKSPRYLEMFTEKAKAALAVQHVVLHQSRRILDDLDFVEVLAPVIRPSPDADKKNKWRVSNDYYGAPNWLTSNMLIYKQALIRSFNKVYTLSPNIRLKPLSKTNSSSQLYELYQLDLEMREKTVSDVIEQTELFLERLFQNVNVICVNILQESGREFPVPSTPFPRITYSELYDVATSLDYPFLYGEEVPLEVEEELSREAKRPFWIIDYPTGSRGFYYREDPKRPEYLLSMKLIYPEGFGEASSGGERETDVQKVVEHLKLSGENIEEYKLYLEMLKLDGKKSAGLGIGVERLVRFILGYKKSQ
ncbi:MAG: hypothetical protein KAS63_05100 [Candidatus Heimdallarchaeota archaeon]|nr:hypothetical protein [Candidatus Heimdallarchaeota archaeon]MCK4954713.1 hypothetical protein [Candidatus Heimdallarchaeota archaeon]